LNISKLNIQQLIEQCVLQNEEAQLEVYNRYFKAMFNVSLRIVKNKIEAEDIMQESFLTAFTKLKTLNNYEMFGSWLKRIVINLSLHTLKKSKKSEKIELDKVTFFLTEEVNEEQEDKDVARLIEKLKQLKESYRIVLTLKFIEGFDYEEIGTIMELSQGNVRTLISRAKESLRKSIKVA